MAKSTVPVNFKDDIMNSSMGGKRRYKMINNSDRTISLEDATTYDQVGSNFGAAQLNATNQAVNAAADAGKIIDDLDAINNVTKEGYMAGALALKQVNSNLVADIYVGDDGKLHKVIGGADTVLPFNNKKVFIAYKLYVINGMDLIIPIENVTKIYCTSSTSTGNKMSAFFRNGESNELLYIDYITDYHEDNPLIITEREGYGEYTHLWLTCSGTATVLGLVIE